MPPDPHEPRPAVRRWLVVAALLHIAAMLLVMLGLLRLTPLTMTFSVGAAGMLLAVACAIFMIGVVIGLRRRQIL
jgi:hypothetical protein